MTSDELAAERAASRQRREAEFQAARERANLVPDRAQQWREEAQERRRKAAERRAQQG